jgi:hypothetical protein
MSNLGFETELSNVKAFVRTTNCRLSELRANLNGVDHNELEALEAKARSYLENSHDGQTTLSLSNLIDSITVVQREAQLAQANAQIAQLQAQLAQEAQRAQAETQRSAQLQAQLAQEAQRAQAETQRSAQLQAQLAQEKAQHAAQLQAQLAQEKAQHAAQLQAQLAQEKAQHAAQIAQKDRLQLIIGGNYFSSLDNVWTSALTNFDETPVDLFDRPDSVIDELFNNDMTYYKTTLNVTDDMEAVTEQNKSRSTSSSLSCNSSLLDIFGNKNAAPKAHLMPASSKDASNWNFIVSGTISNVARNMPHKMSMFLNGSRNKSDPSDPKTNRRVAHSGIKHFPTNIIRLSDQYYLYDKWPCVFIVPILSVEDIKNWDGAGYDAIVLADSCPFRSEADVYQEIRATLGLEQLRDDEFLATDDDIEICRNSLEQLILFLAKSYMDMAEPDSAKNNKESPRDEDVLWKKLKEKQVNVPKPCYRQGCRVRKTKFTARKGQHDENLHLAPDPMLLLSKTASNWLRKHELNILPVSVAVSETDSESTSVLSVEIQSFGQIASLSRSEYGNKPPVAEISFFSDMEKSVSISSY